MAKPIPEIIYGVTVSIADFRPNVEQVTKYTGDNISRAVDVFQRELSMMKEDTSVNMTIVRLSPKTHANLTGTEETP